MIRPIVERTVLVTSTIVVVKIVVVIPTTAPMLETTTSTALRISLNKKEDDGDVRDIIYLFF